MEILILILIIFLVIAAISSYYQPKFDFILLGENHLRVVMWHNHWDGPIFTRKYKVIIER